MALLWRLCQCHCLSFSFPGILPPASCSCSVFTLRAHIAPRGTGWTLVFTSKTNTWEPSNVFKRGQATLDGDFSILAYADEIKENPAAAGARFQYRIEASEFGRWGGIWSAPRHYPMASSYHFLSEVELEQRFDQWSYNDDGLEQRLPYYLGASAMLSTSAGRPSSQWWGTLAAKGSSWMPGPYLNPELPSPGNVWYWLREGPTDFTERFEVHPYGVSPDNPGLSCVDIKAKAPATATKLGIYFVKDSEGVAVRRVSWGLALNLRGSGEVGSV